MVAPLRSKYAMTLLIALAGLGVTQPPPAPRFTGKSIPVLPRQKEPWTPPATRLPRFLVSATAALFDEGLADPRGCEYREVDIGEGARGRMHGFVLPPREGEAHRFVVGWDGVIYPAASVGEAADLENDVRGDVETMRRARQDAAGRRDAGRPAALFARASMYGWGGPGGVAPTALRVCLLLRLGRADLAEALFAAGTTWTPEVRGRDLTDYGITYLTLAQDWAGIVFLRLIGAHMGGRDAIALDAARRLSAFSRSAEARARELGFGLEANRFTNEPPSYFPFLRQLPELLADQERRAREPARGPVPPRGGDPAARVAALIRDLDQIAERQMVHFGNSPLGSPLLSALTAEGEAAVEPLLAAVESDTRLTRTTTRGRDITSVDYRVHPVLEVELAALTAILKPGSEFAGRPSNIEGNPAARKELARAMRDFWTKNRTVSLDERCYRTLRDDDAGFGRWIQAASSMKGEELRGRRDPSVSELLARRALEIARAPGQRTIPDVRMDQACELASRLEGWDPRAALPVLRELMTRALGVIERDRLDGYHREQKLMEFVARFAVIRARAGEREALAAYAAEIRKDDPKDQHLRVLSFEPMWIFPDDPAIREAARWLFNDPASPWAAFLRAPGRRTMDYFFQDTSLYTSPLLGSPGFRDGVIAALANRSVMGTVRRNQQDTIQYETEDGSAGGFQAAEADLEGLELGAGRPYRACDYIAWQISSIEGAPRCELYWPEERRDAAIAACAAYLKTYGDRFTIDAPGDEPDAPHQKRAHLAFPILDRPATPEDVRAARAIFSMAGAGEARLAGVAGLPIQARWTTLEDVPADRPGHARPGRKDPRDGWIWQAEEVRKGAGWERYYGFVGNHVIARVPAAEIELAGGHSDRAWGPLGGGLDARIEPVDRSFWSPEPGRPIPAIVRLRNRRGVANAAPTEFLRRGDDGRMALRRGVTLRVYYSPPKPNGSDMVFDWPDQEVKPKRMDHFDPGAATRPLSPFEAFEVIRLDLGDWFDLTRRGKYRVQVTFGADSGVGEGTSNHWLFSVGQREGFIP